MNIVIVGAGKVGGNLAKHLLNEGHDITVIDSNEQILSQVSNTLDVISYCGNGASYLTLSEGGAEKADLLIAATESDEVNMLCCLTANKLGVKHAIARVRDPEYYDQCNILRGELGLSMVINPELAAAQEIARILRFPSATHVEMFADGRVELVSYRIKENSLLNGVPLHELPKKTGLKVLICAAEREGEVYIPTGDFVPHTDDVLYFTGSPAEMIKAFNKVNLSTARSRNVIIVGGGRIAFYLASTLEKEGVAVKIIERNAERAEELSRILPHTVIIEGDIADHELLTEEGMDNIDAFVALTGMDESNILAAMYALRKNVKKVIAKVNNEDLVELVRDTSLETVISPKRITVNQILRYVRALAAGDKAANVLSLYKLLDSRVEVLEFAAEEAGDYLNKPLKDLSLKKQILVACIVRGGKVIIPDGSCEIHIGDGVLVVTSDMKLQSLADIVE